MTKPMIFTRGMFVGMVIIALALLVALIGLWTLNKHLNDQQDRADDLSRQNAALIARDNKTLTEVCRLATGLSLTQPNLDPQFLRTLNEIIGELPRRCFP